jgi:chorismate mutase
LALELNKTPIDCISKEEIRIQIDAIDAEIIQLFALRNSYVHEIVKFKNDEKSVIAQRRKDEVIKLRGEWAEKLGLDKKTFEEMYRLLIENNIQSELKILNNKK